MSPHGSTTCSITVDFPDTSLATSSDLSSYAYILQGLLPNAVYEFQVSIRYSNGGSYSDPITATGVATPDDGIIIIIKIIMHFKQIAFSV